MRCTVCGHGETRPGNTTLTLEREGATVVVRRVTALVCTNCGEVFVDERAAEIALKAASRAIADGVTVEVRDYIAA